MKIAICGCGTIGGSVFDLLKNNKEIEVVSVFDREIKRPIYGDLLTTDYNTIINDTSIELVVETMGGVKLAYPLIKAALNAKKNVVTANKEVIALYLDELVALAKENNVTINFEASVGGGIPVIKGISEIMYHDNITHIIGILNGTTNYILTKIQNDGMSFEEALKEAQVKGYAEFDPSADLLGLDMVRKIAILTMLATNSKIDISKVTNVGINTISSDFIKTLNGEGYTLKFVCEASISKENIDINVFPCAFRKDSVMASIKYENNIASIDCVNNDTLTFIGKGAGGNPTGSIIINDIYDIMHNNKYIHYENLNEVKVNELEIRKDYLLYVGDELIEVSSSNLDFSEGKQYCRVIY